MRFVFPTSQTKRYRFPTHVNDLVVDRADSETSEVFIVILRPDEAPPLHKHDDTEQVFYILEGNGVLRTGRSEKRFAVCVGDVVRIPAKTLHSIQCTGKQSLRYLVVDCFIVGRPKNEPTWNRHVKVLCKQQGWNYRKVMEKP